MFNLFKIHLILSVNFTLVINILSFFKQDTLIYIKRI